MRILPYGLTVFFVTLMSLPATAQVEFRKVNDDIQYKRVTRDIFTLVIAGRLDEAEETYQQLFEAFPNDLEGQFGMAAIAAQREDITAAMEWVKKSIENGLPLQRYLAGPRSVFQNLYESEAFQTLLRRLEDEHNLDFIHGPLLGVVTDASAQFWVRSREIAPFRVYVKETGSDSPPYQSTTLNTRKDTDYTAVVAINDLQPDTEYQYTVEIAGKKAGDQWTFRTQPRLGEPAEFEAGFGGGAGYTPPHERIWDTIRGHNLNAFFTLGDNVYIDTPEIPDVQRYCYYRRQSRPEFRRFTASVPIYAIWDDHDFVDNDGWGGPQIAQPEWKLPVWRLFKQQWNNPDYGGGEEQPGCWFDTHIADVHFIFLDGRYYRTDPNQPNPSMLGRAQKQWLFHTLKNSKATFKVLASPVPFAYGTKPGSLDTWQGYKREREEIFSFIHNNQIEGVFLITADRHRSDAWKIAREDGYDFYEFQSSQLTNIHTHELIEEALFGYNEKNSFGKLVFDTTAEDPAVTYEIWTIDNEKIHDFTLKHSQLLSHQDVND